jgi:hypothetical protein
MRVRHIVLAALLVVPAACKKKRDDSEIRAAVEKHRPRAEARLARLREIGTVKLAGPDPIRLGDRPPIKLLADYWVAYGKEPSQDGYNGRLMALFDFADLSKPVLDRSISLLTERKWFESPVAILKAGVSSGVPEVERVFGEFFAVRYVAVLAEDSISWPKVESVGSQVSFEPGRFAGRFWIFDLEDGQWLGGASVTAANSAKVDFQYKYEGQKEQQARESVVYDLKKNIRKAVVEAIPAK